MITEELAREQEHVDRAYQHLERLREKAKALVEGVLDHRLDPTHQGRYERDVTEHTGFRRLASLQLGSLPLVFGRIDRADGEHFHIGRVAVNDEHHTPLVVDWRAPVAEPFYRATPHAPLGLARRRHFRTRGPRLLGMDDERFSAGGDESDLPVVGEAALLEALSRSRTGRMTDIVETIQAEQDAVIRAPLEGVLVVQGGPGTGKTAVALHRAAYLLYTHRVRLERTGVLLLGPTPVFLRYIEEVLPALGEQRVRMATVRDLVRWCAPTATDPPAVARLKGDPRMAKVLAKDSARAGGSNSPLIVLRDLLSSPKRIAVAARGVLSVDEQAVIARPEWRGFSEADLPLLDELAALRPRRRTGPRRPRLEQEERWYLERFVAEIAATHPMDEVMAGDLFTCVVEARLDLEESPDEGDQGTYGHVLVDEAQDLSPMQWRMLTRRCPSRSMTIVGDLGQATGPWALQRWEDVTALLNAHRTTVTELTINYRTPEEIMAFADALRPAWLRPARPVRRVGAAPLIRRVPPDALRQAVASGVAEALATVEGTVGVVAPDALLPSIAATDDRVTTLGVRDAKGLEFDAVIVVEPARIADEVGLRALYVALTRATQRLTLVSTRPLPVELRRNAAVCHGWGSSPVRDEPQLHQ